MDAVEGYVTLKKKKLQQPRLLRLKPLLKLQKLLLKKLPTVLCSPPNAKLFLYILLMCLK